MNNNKIATANVIRASVMWLIGTLFSILISHSALANDVTLQFGPFGSNANGIIDGAGPFGTAVEDGAGGLVPCGSATDTQLEGADCGDNNGVIRTQDIALHVFSVAATGGDPTIPIGENIIEDVVLEMTLHPSADAQVDFDRIPSPCEEIAGGGTNPPSSIVTNPDGTVTLICNMGGISNGEAKFISAPVKVSGLSHNGSSYTTTQRIYSVPNAATTTVNTYEDGTPIIISGAPAWDLVFSPNVFNSPTSSMVYSGTGYRDVGFGSELGFFVDGMVNLVASRKAGIESITEDITFDIDFTRRINSTTGPVFPAEYYVDSCTKHGIGTNGFSTNANSGDCTFTRADPGDNTSSLYNFTITGSDLSGNNYPTQERSTDLSAGPYIATSHQIRTWIPLRSIDQSDGVADNTGAIYIGGVVSEFSPTSVSGVSNYGSSAEEPGYNGNLMDDGTRSNNELGARLVQVSVGGAFAKFYYNNQNFAGNIWAGNQSSYRGGEKSSGEVVASTVTFSNNGSVDLTDPVLCDVFDNTTLQLTSISGVPHLSSGTGYAFIGSNMGTTAATSVTASDLIIEYANLDFTGDDPLDNNNDGSLDYDIATGVYEGKWDNQKASQCNDSDATGGWFTDPTALPGGIDAVNAVRVRQTESSFDAGLALTPKQAIRLILGLKVRTDFNGGPHDTETMPFGTIMANFATVRSDQWNNNWVASNYNPFTDNNTIRGDRLVLAKVRLALNSNSLTPAASPGQTASTLAGNQVVWQLISSISTNDPDGAIGRNLQIFSLLPPEATYNRGCTESQANHTLPGLVQYNTDLAGNPAPGYTRLVWNLGDYPANQAIPNRIFCTDTDPLAADNTAVKINSVISSDDSFTPYSLRHDGHTVSLLQVGNVKMSKTVDAALDDRNDDQVFTLAWANFSDAFEVEPGVIIDVLPHDGDSNSPPSLFSGVYELVGEPTLTFLDGSVPDASEDPIGTWYYTNNDPTLINPSPLDDTSNWCLAIDFGSGGCPSGFDDVTAIKLQSHHNLSINGTPRQGVRAQVTIQAGDPTFTDRTISNLPSDQYTNKFTFGSPSLPENQYLTSGSVTVWVASYSIGDLIFADINGDGLYDPAVDFPAPDGVVVNLHEADGTLIRTTTTGLEKPGRYLFTKIDKGDFYVEIPASEFQPGAPMHLWVASGVMSDPNDNKNDNEDQHAYSPTSPEIDGIRSGIITMDAEPATPGGGVPLGLEPLADNTAGLTNDTLDDFSNYGLDLGVEPTFYTVSGTVWNDVNKDGTRQNSEAGMSNTTVVLYGFVFGDQNNMVCESVNTDANGFYQFSLLSGDYQVIEAANEAVPIDSTTCPPAESDPAGFVSTTPNTRSFTIYQTNLQRQDFGNYAGFKLSGTVFDDNGTGGGTSGNNAQDGSEPGISGVTVTATDGSGTVYDTAITDTDGNYEMIIPGSATSVVITEQNPSGYASVGGSSGSATAGSYDLASDSITFNTSAALSYTDLDFADIKKPTLMPDNTGSVSPGLSINYLHRFSTPVAGSVTFNSVEDFSITSGWSTLLYHDVDCNGSIDAGEANIEGQTLPVNAGESICLINKVNAPANAAVPEQHRTTITATFEDASSSTSNLLSVEDVTTVTAGDASELEIRKSVQNMTQGTPATESSNDANPGDELRYRITYRNTGDSEITDVVIRDSVPAFTTYKPSSASCDSTPAGMVCTPTVTSADIDWTMNNPLQGGESGQVSYEVIVDN